MWYVCTTWMNLKCIMLSEISQTNKDKHYVTSPISGSWKSLTHRKRVEWCLPGPRHGGNGEDAGQSVQNFRYKMNKFWGSTYSSGPQPFWHQGLVLPWGSILMIWGGAEAVMLALGSSCKYRWSFACLPAARLLLCSLVPNRPWTSTQYWSAARRLGTPDVQHSDYS